MDTETETENGAVNYQSDADVDSDSSSSQANEDYPIISGLLRSEPVSQPKDIGESHS